MPELFLTISFSFEEASKSFSLLSWISSSIYCNYYYSSYCCYCWINKLAAWLFCKRVNQIQSQYHIKNWIRNLKLFNSLCLKIAIWFVYKFICLLVLVLVITAFRIDWVIVCFILILSTWWDTIKGLDNIIISWVFKILSIWYCSDLTHLIHSLKYLVIVVGIIRICFFGFSPCWWWSGIIIIFSNK